MHAKITLFRLAIGGLELAKRPSIHDEANRLGEARVGTSLARIADALNLPVSHFYTAAGGKAQVDKDSELSDEALLSLVRSYLQIVDPAARREFVEAVKNIADGLPS